MFLTIGGCSISRYQVYLICLVCFVLGGLGGILFQRFLPIGTLLERVGLRDLLPVPRDIPENDPGYISRDWDVPIEDRGRLTLFVLMGQSNMSGRGSLSSPHVPQPHPQIFSFNKNFRWEPAKEPLGSGPHEVDWVASDGGTGVGPGIAFARELLEQDPTLKIGLVPCARGSSSIDDWRRDLGQNSLYGSCLRRVRAASTYGTIAAVLFSQGEADARETPDQPGQTLLPATWAVKFEKVIEALRDDLSQHQLPVLFTQLGSYVDNEHPQWEIVKAQQAQVSMHNAILITTDDLLLQSDGHFDTETQTEIGRRFAKAYVDLVGSDQ